MLTIRARKGGPVHRLLTIPLRRTTLAKAELSHWVWYADGHGNYVLRPLGILNRLFGVVLELRP